MMPVDGFFRLMGSYGVGYQYSDEKAVTTSKTRINRFASWVTPLFDDDAEIVFDQPGTIDRSEPRELVRRIRAAVEEAGLTQRAISRSVGVKESAVSDWVRGKSYPSPENQVAIVRYLEGGAL